MSEGSDGVLERWFADSRRPAGGWTVAFGLPQWAAWVLMLALFTVHMSWGATGYYPRRI